MKKLISLSLLVFVLQSMAQDESIVTDRPTQSAAAFVVPKGNVLLETGFVSERIAKEVTNLTYLNALLRWGVFDGVEFRVTQNIVGSKAFGETNSGLSPLTIGTKTGVWEENGLLPQMSVIGQVTFETGSDQFKGQSTVVEIRFNFQNTLSETFALGYNFGYVDSDFNDFFYTVVLGASVADGWTAFVEPYAFFGEDMDQRINAGLIYLAGSNLQFDVSAGYGISNISPHSFVGFGAAFGF